MIYFFIPIIGLFFGYLIAKLTKEELKPGIFYFNLLELIILLFLPLIFVFYSFNLILFIFGLIFGFIIRNEYFYFSFGLISSFFNINLAFLTSSLVFIYSISYGTILYYNKDWNNLFYSLILFFLTFIIYFFRYNMLSFAAGALLILFIIKLINFIKTN